MEAVSSPPELGGDRTQKLLYPQRVAMLYKKFTEVKSAILLLFFFDKDIVGSPRLDILIHILIIVEFPVNSGGATKQKSNFRKK